MNEQNQRDSIMSMARGAFEERVDYEMDKVIQNILDPNTKATAKRKITLTIELGARPNEHGRHAAGGSEAPEARPARINTHNTEQGGQHNARKNDRQNRQPEGDQDLRD